MSDEEKVSNVQIEKVTEFKAGENVFRSNGYSNVKVTQNGKIVCKQIPIQSTGISDLVDSFQDKAPQPPVKNVLVKPDDEIGKQMGVTEKKWVKLPDYADPNYIKALEEHNTRLGNAILLKGIAVDIKDKDGKIIEDQDAKIAVLKSMEMSGSQFQQIVDDIQSLTKWKDNEKINFLE